MLFITRQYKLAENQKIKITIKWETNLPGSHFLLCDLSLAGGSRQDREIGGARIRRFRVVILRKPRVRIHPGTTQGSASWKIPFPALRKALRHLWLMSGQSLPQTAQIQVNQNLLYPVAICSMTEPLVSSLTVVVLLQRRHTHKTIPSGRSLARRAIFTALDQRTLQPANPKPRKCNSCRPEPPSRSVGGDAGLRTSHPLPN